VQYFSHAQTIDELEFLVHDFEEKKKMNMINNSYTQHLEKHKAVLNRKHLQTFQKFI